MSTVDIPDIEYEHWCARCRGTGKHPKQLPHDGKVIDGPLMECATCNGTGYYMSDDGARLLEFLRHQGVIR